MLEVLQWLQEISGTLAKVKFCVENVASMDESVRRQISAHLDAMPGN
jgi:hypothetical protein